MDTESILAELCGSTVSAGMSKASQREYVFTGVEQVHTNPLVS